MSEKSDKSTAARSVAAGAVAGAIGGLVGAAVKLLCEAIVPPRTSDREPPPGVLAGKLVHAVSGRDLSAKRKGTIALVVHWVFSTLTSAAYGASFGRTSDVRIGNGMAFGITLWAGFHEIFLPLTGGTPPLREVPASEQINEFVNHSIFGATVEYVRAFVLRALPAAQ